MTNLVLVMYDSVNASGDPPGGDIYAAYDDGNYANVSAVLARFPDTPILTIDVTGSRQAQALDIEAGDATTGQADRWLGSFAIKGPVFDRPVLYMSLDTAKAGWPVTHPDGCLLWTAHYTNTPHICGQPCGLPYDADMTQWESTQNYDRSEVNPAHFIFGRTGTVAAHQGGTCPAGGQHDGSLSYTYELTVRQPASAPLGQSGWYWCHKCQGLFFTNS